jgi:outer membrane protein OmpA-like peptidoglycan-associated protein
VNYQVFVSVKVLEPVFEVKDDPNSRVLENRPLPNGPIVVSQGLTDERYVTDELGQFVMRLDWNTKYTFTARYRDHLASSFTINTDDIEKDPVHPITTLNRMLVLDPIFKNKEIVLENIFYDYDQWVIREDAKPSLNRLSTILKTNPTIRIRLASHTDCRGTDEYNLELSQKRAQAAIDYLMSTGIPSRRLEAIGMGESSPAVICNCDDCTEDQHQTNRRTTFQIID